MTKLNRILNKEINTHFAKNLNRVDFVDGKFLADCITLFSRFKCQNCGLYGRAILCPPMLAMTYPQFETIKSSRKFYSEEVKIGAVLTFKNNGTIPWKINENELSHIEFKKRFGRQLKGVENGSAKAINKYMRRMQTCLRQVYNLNAMSFIAGHCDVCPDSHRCPNRSNPPCKHNGLTSLEATGLDVYKILQKLKIEYEYPALTYLTQVTLLVVRK